MYMVQLTMSLATATMVLAAQSNAQQLPAIRPIGRVLHISQSNRLGSVTAVRALTNGNVIVNDIVRRQLVLMDSTLTSLTIVLDSAKSPRWNVRRAGWRHHSLPG